MRYGIFKYPVFVEISENEYVQIKSATKNLFEVLFLEEKLDLVTGDFLEYETELLSIASRMMIYRNDDYFSINNDRVIVGRRVMNLMSACRMYLDQCIHHITNLYGDDSALVTQIKNEKLNQYENYSGYRIMEAFRNYVQHRGSPVHGVWLSYRTIDIDEQYELLHTIIPYIKPSVIEDDGKFKKSILEEMKTIAIKDQIDIRPLIREYVEGIGKIHEKIREFIKSDIEKWENILESTVTKLEKEFEDRNTISSLEIVIEVDENRWVEHHTIFKDFLERRQALERKNRFFNNLAKSFATNEVKEQNA